MMGLAWLRGGTLRMRRMIFFCALMSGTAVASDFFFVCIETFRRPGHFELRSSVIDNKINEIYFVEKYGIFDKTYSSF